MIDRLIELFTPQSLLVVGSAIFFWNSPAGFVGDAPCAHRCDPDLSDNQVIVSRDWSDGKSSGSTRTRLPIRLTVNLQGLRAFSCGVLRRRSGFP